MTNLDILNDFGVEEYREQLFLEENRDMIRKIRQDETLLQKWRKLVDSFPEDDR